MAGVNLVAEDRDGGPGHGIGPVVRELKAASTVSQAAWVFTAEIQSSFRLLIATTALGHISIT